MRPEKINKVPIDKTRKIIFILIIAICLIAIGFALYYQYYKDEKIGIIIGINTEEEKKLEEISELKSNFNSLFDNTLIGENNNINYNKLDKEKDVVYSIYKINKENKNYVIDMQLPYINLNSNVVNKYNNEIKENFITKAKEIIKNNVDTNNIFSVSYKGYINDNILSIVIKGELKEGTNSQRIIIQTYNYNINEDKEINVNDILSTKGIAEKEANNIIKEEIEQKQEQNKKLYELGYEMYTREYNEQIHTIKNTTEFFIDNNNNIYIIYPYGNNDITSEMDLIIM